MKRLYLIILFLAIFQGVVLMVNAMDVFPTTFYDDSEVNDKLRNADSGWEAMSAMLTPNTAAFGLEEAPLTIAAIVIAFGTIGTGVAIFTHSFLPVVITIVGYSFFTMMTHSYNFISKLFQWETDAMTYMALCIGIGITFIVIITLVEMPAHGRSG